jgi:sulfhydrogenase subunit beta (sulfur reductase)
MVSENGIILAKEDLISVLRIAMETMTVIAPVRGLEGESHFQTINSTDELFWEYTHDLYPTKNFFFAQEEDLLRYKLEGELHVDELPASNQKRVIFGIRSCDVKALQYSDLFFSHYNYPDKYYLEKRKDSIVISLACVKPPFDSCFCICTNSGPFLESGFDLQIVDLGGKYLVDVGTQSGEELLKIGNGKYLSATAADLQKLEELKKEADTHFNTVSYFAKAIIQMTSNNVEEKLWEEFAEACISCGSCTHLCPMCTCFDVYDRTENGNWGTRTRHWDSCNYEGYTREASGHNPRVDRTERIKRRCYHKLSYYYMKINGNFHGCVGCGRCVNGCPVSLDIPSIMKRIRREGLVKRES